jgi:hypothetical protein
LVTDDGTNWAINLQVRTGLPAAGQVAISEHHVYDV